MTDDPATRLRTYLAEFPGTSAFDPEDIEALLAKHDRYAALLAEASEALRVVGKAAITVEPVLKQPYPEAPEMSPWSRWMEAPARRAYNLGHQIRRELSAAPKEPTT